MRVVLVLVLLVRVVSAQPGMTEPIPVGADEPIPTAPVHRPEPALLSESTALWLSLGSTLGSYTMWGLVQGIEDRELGSSLALLGGVGTFLAPSFGHWYAGKFFTRGLGYRTVAIGTAFVGLVMLVSCIGEGSSCDTRGGIGAGIMLGSAGLWVYGTIDDIVQAPRRVARINEARLSSTYALVPTASGDRVGFALVGRF